MKASSSRSRRVRGMFRGKSWWEALQSAELKQLSYGDRVAFYEIFNERTEERAIGILPDLVNLGDSPAEIQEFRRVCPEHYDICQGTDADLIAFRDELRKVWDQAKGSQKIVDSWYLAKWPPTGDEDFFRNWIISFKAKTIIPAPANFRAQAANLCGQHPDCLKRCANPGCQQYFIAARKDGKYCLAPDCVQYGSRARAREHWRRTHWRA